MASPTLVFRGVLVGIDREFIEEIENELFIAGLFFFALKSFAKKTKTTTTEVKPVMILVFRRYLTIIP